MSADPKEVFRQKCVELVKRYGMKKSSIIEGSKVNRSSVYGFLGKSRENLEDQSLDRLALFLFGESSWVNVAMAKQDAEQNDRQKADDKKGDGGMNIGDLYERLGEIRNEMKREFEALNHKIDSHISSITAHHSPARDKKFSG